MRPTLALAALAATAALATSELAGRHAAARSRLPVAAAATTGVTAVASAPPADAAVLFSQDVDPSWAAFLEGGLARASLAPESPFDLGLEGRAPARDSRSAAADVPEPPTLALVALAALGLALRSRHHNV